MPMDYGFNGEPYIARFDKEKLIRCDYNKRAILTPWDCQTCTSEKCEKFDNVKEVFSIYPEFLKTNNRTVDIYIDKDSECNIKRKILKCGKNEPQTLKLTRRGAVKVISVPEKVKIFDGAYLNSKLWAKEVEFNSAYIKYQIGEHLLTVEERKTREYLINYKTEKGLAHLISAQVIWKDDFSDEITGDTKRRAVSVDIHYNKNWFEDKAFREWLANAFDVTKEHKNIKIYKDKHNNWVIE